MNDGTQRQPRDRLMENLKQLSQLQQFKIYAGVKPMRQQQLVVMATRTKKSSPEKVKARTSASPKRSDSPKVPIAAKAFLQQQVSAAQRMHRKNNANNLFKTIKMPKQSGTGTNTPVPQAMATTTASSIASTTSTITTILDKRKPSNDVCRKECKTVQLDLNYFMQVLAIEGSEERSQSIFQPAFNGCRYYQTHLVHFHYEHVYRTSSPFEFQFERLYSTAELLSYFKELYEDHFIQNFYSIKYCQQFQHKPVDQIKAKTIFLPNQTEFKSTQFSLQKLLQETIVFDLDETLIHSKDIKDASTDLEIDLPTVSNDKSKAFISLRPYLFQMLQVLHKHYELLVFTASHKQYADKVLDYIDPNRELFTQRFFRENCMQVEDQLFVKDLRVIGNRKIENILLVDNAAYSFAHQLNHGVPIIPYYENKSDKELIYLTHYLVQLKNSADWTRANASSFRFDYYQKAETPEKCLQILLGEDL